MYRKYVDQYLKYGRKGYRVSPGDRKMLLELFDRGGFTEGYYQEHNGRDMVAYKEKPAFREGNQELFDYLDRMYVDHLLQEPVRGTASLEPGKAAKLTLECLSVPGEDGKPVSVTVSGQIVQEALNQPMARDKVAKQLQKTGNTPFAFEKLAIEMDEGIFLPVQALNALRREALEALEAASLKRYRRKAAGVPKTMACGKAGGISEKRGQTDRNSRGNLAVSTETRSLRDCILSKPFVDDIYYDSACYGGALFDELAEDVYAAHEAGKKAYYILPAVFRGHTAEFYRKHKRELLAAGIDGVVAKSFDAAAFTRTQLGQDVPMILDHSLYTWNAKAKRLLWELSPLRDTAPLELNRGELFGRDNRGSEILIYGYLPLMTSVQCVHANTGACDKSEP